MIKNENDFYKKYLKYKKKYNELKNHSGGVFNKDAVSFLLPCEQIDLPCLTRLNSDFNNYFLNKTPINYPMGIKSKYNLQSQSNLVTTYNLLKLLNDFEILKPEHSDQVDELSCNIHKYCNLLFLNLFLVGEGLFNNPSVIDVNLNLISAELIEKLVGSCLNNELTGLFEILNQPNLVEYNYELELIKHVWSRRSIDNFNKICNFLDTTNIKKLQSIIEKLIIEQNPDYPKIILQMLKPNILDYYLTNKSDIFNAYMLEILQKNFDSNVNPEVTSKISYQYVDLIRYHLTQKIIGGRQLNPTLNSHVTFPIYFCSYNDGSSEPFVSELFDKITMDFINLLYDGQFEKIFCFTNFANPDKKFVLFDGENVLFKIRNSIDIIDLHGNSLKPSENREKQYNKFFTDLFFYNQNYTYITFFEGPTCVVEEIITSSHPVGTMETYFIYSSCESGITYNEPFINPYNSSLFCNDKTKNLKSLPCYNIFGKNENDDYMLFLFYWILKLCGNEPKVISGDNYKWSMLKIPKHRIELEVVRGNYSNIIVDNFDLLNTDLLNMMKRLEHRNKFKNGKLRDNKGFEISDKYYYLYNFNKGILIQMDAQNFINFGITTGTFNQLNNTYYFTENSKGTVKSFIRNFLKYSIPNYKKTGGLDNFKLRIQRYYLTL